MKYLDKPCKRELYSALMGNINSLTATCLKQVSSGLEAAGFKMEDLMNLASKREKIKKEKKENDRKILFEVLLIVIVTFGGSFLLYKYYEYMTKDENIKKNKRKN